MSIAVTNELEYPFRIEPSLFRIIKAAITPGAQPINVRSVTMIIEPQPLSRTANGGNNIQNINLEMLIFKYHKLFNNIQIIEESITDK